MKCKQFIYKTREVLSYPFFILAYNFLALGELIIGKKLHIECHEETKECRWCKF